MSAAAGNIVVVVLQLSRDRSPRLDGAIHIYCRLKILYRRDPPRYHESARTADEVKRRMDVATMDKSRWCEPARARGSRAL